jgi:hypothetical protein
MNETHEAEPEKDDGAGGRADLWGMPGMESVLLIDMAAPLGAQQPSRRDERCAHGVSGLHECRECAEQPSKERMGAWMRSIGRGA